MNRSWPLHVHLILIVWVCYALALFFIVTTQRSTLLAHIFMLSVPPWYLGRAMTGAYLPRKEPPR